MASQERSQESLPPWWLALLVVGLGCGLTASATTTWLSQRDFAVVFLSPSTWERMAPWLGGDPLRLPGDEVPVSFLRVLSATSLLAAMSWLGGGVLLSCYGPSPWGAALRRWGVSGWIWWCLGGAWEWVWVAMAATGWQAGTEAWVACLPFWVAFCLAGWVTTWLHQRQSLCEPSLAERSSRSRDGLILAGMMATYAGVFVTLNWRLWFNLFIPHGDSAMYEEHLWNLLHGKGFRSYLDQGLFLGEHVQFVHLGLLPLYILWPSHLLLELCESVALAAGVFPIARMVQRHTGSSSVARWVAAAYLLYFPMQFLDIEIDLKTFRPEAFGIPLLLFTLDQLDCGQKAGFLLGVLACATVKEDYALVFMPLGLWIAATAWKAPNKLRSVTPAWTWFLLGACLVLGSLLYLWLATRVIMPWFRTGEEIHYTRYFSRLGETPEQIVWTIITRPDVVSRELFTLSTAVYAMALLVPVGGVALLSPGRLAVGLPLFGVLCLNELARFPRHHFHAPLVPLVFWALASGLPRVPRVWSLVRRSAIPEARMIKTASYWVVSSALCGGLFFSLSPLGFAFWDPGSNWYWWKLYGPTRRGIEFAKVAARIPLSARVACTDFVHPRFTHHERSYDYSGYLRKVSGYQRRVPEDTDFIVIDCTHPYSQYHHPTDVPEFHQTEDWELVPDETNGYYIVLQRRRHNAQGAEP